MSADITIVAAGIVAATQPVLADEAAGLAQSTSVPTIAQTEVSPTSPMPVSIAEPELVGQPISTSTPPTFSSATETNSSFSDGKTLPTTALGSLATVEAAEAQLIHQHRIGEQPLVLDKSAIAERASGKVEVENAIDWEYQNQQSQASLEAIGQAASNILLPEASADVSFQAIAPEQSRLDEAAATESFTLPNRLDSAVSGDPLQNQPARFVSERYRQERALALDRFEAQLAHSQTQRQSQQQVQQQVQNQVRSQTPGSVAIAETMPAPESMTRPPAQPTVESATQQTRRLSPERQFLTQVMLERAEAEFLLEIAGVAGPLVAEGASTPAAIGSGPVAKASLPEAPGAQKGMAENDIGQITNVFQLRDVQPTDWAYQATQSLIERYGCAAGYPNQQFRGDRALSRYEFAAGLNACLERVAELLPVVSAGDQVNVAGGGFAAQADLAIIQQLSEQFQLELEQLRDRADSLEQRQADLEAQQFSTTTKLYGQTIFGLRGSNNNNVDLFPVDGNPERSGAGDVTFSGSTELTLASSFSGSDLLLTTLQAGNFASSAPTQFTNMGRLAYEGNTNSQVLLADLSYRFAATPDLGIIVGTHGINPTNTFRGISPMESSGDGALSRLGQRNPILDLGGGRGGAGFDWQMSPNLSLQGVYSAATPNQAGRDSGLLSGGYVTGGQLSAGLGQRVDLGVHYLHAYTPNGSLGTGVGDAQVLSPFASQSSSFHTHAIGAAAAWHPTQHLTLGGWGGWTSSRPTSLSGRVQTTNWMGFAQVNDLFRQGNALGVLVGQPPKITSSNLPVGFNFPEFSNGGGPGGRRNTALHLEAFYRAQLSEQISLTPGIVVVKNPNHNASNETLVVGAMRTTFRF